MIYLEETSQAIQTMLVMIIYHPSDPCICVITPLRMYFACTRCRHGDDKALFISSLSQFLEEQLAKV